MQRINPGDFAPQTTTAIQAVCAWPNLTLLPDGTLIAAIFNQSCHGIWEGDLDAWASTDNGTSWQLRGTIAPHDQPNTNRMNCAVGLAQNGDMVALCAGWTGRGDKGKVGKPHHECARLGARAYRSADSGKTWKPTGDLPLTPHGAIVPFGDIHITSDNRLIATGYAQRPDQGPYLVFTLQSTDDGRTWSIGSVINDKGNETSIIQLTPGKWLAASREEADVHVEQFTSDDNARTWKRIGPITHPGQVTSHLLRLKDGRILLSYGNRCMNNYGVDVRTSADEGQTWSAPIRIADCPLRDCGYPASLQLADGSLITAFYTQLPGWFQYEMRVTKWKLP